MFDANRKALNFIACYFIAIFCLLFLSTSSNGQTVQITVGIKENRKTVDRDIFGVNYADSSHLASVPYTVNRKGGNADTRYNWEKGVSNKANDWFFFNIADDVTNTAALPEGTAATKFVDTSLSTKSKPMLVASMIGFTPLDDRSKKWGFSKAKYGVQQKTECTETGYASWCTDDAGNGKRQDGTKVTGNDYKDTSKVIDHTYATRWIQFLQQRGTPVEYWELDNEPDLWSSTHFDVHPAPLTYDELWTKTVQYAGAIKATNSSIKIFGPSSWGWCGYFYSPKDDCKSGPDRQAHNDLPLIAYYLKQLCDYEKTNKKRLVDYLDIHYYPQADGVFDDKQTVDNNAALRLRTVRSLYDTTYVDESWIANAEQGDMRIVKLLPRMKGFLNTYCPQLKLAITEYNFGADVLLSSALAQVEVLSIFAKEGVDLATRFIVPKVGTLVERAFKLYLNYDGKGAQVVGEIVSTNTTDISVPAYTFHSNANQKAFIIIINKYTTSVNSKVTIPEAKSRNALLYGFSQTDNNLNNFGNVNSDANGVISITLRPMSATMVVISTDKIQPDPQPSPGISPKVSPKVSPGIPAKSSNTTGKQSYRQLSHVGKSSASGMKIGGFLMISLLLCILSLLLL
ncbi:hypothetical protein ABK040_005879 [Willaertia magna]